MPDQRLMSEGIPSGILSRILSTLSIAMKAGRVTSGETIVLTDIKQGRSKLLLIAEDASDGTKKKFTDKSGSYDVPCYILGTKESIAHAIGKEMRSVVSVNDKGFADTMISRLEEADINGEQQKSK